jgi:chemotaxis protein MotB
MDAKRPIIIKKKIVHGGHHGGAWKVAYADFVTAMMALFIVLWLLTSNEKVRQAVGGYFKDPIGRGKNPGTSMQGSGRDLSVLKDDMSTLKEKLQSAIKLIPHFEQLRGNVEFTITDEGLRIELIENSKGIFFESGKPEPSDVGKELLLVLAKELGKIPNRILIEGHTDAQQYSDVTGYSNWELSADRANAARRLMEAQGLAPNQVAQIRGYADQDLRIKDHPEDPANRRVTLIVRYLDAPKQLKLAALNGKISATEQHPAVNPATLAPAAASASEKVEGKSAKPDSVQGKGG